jgi:hypothetical protein
MMNPEECVALSTLTADEIAVIGAQGREPEIAALLRNYLVRSPDGAVQLSDFIREDIDAALQAGDVLESARLKLVVRRFLQDLDPSRAPR